MTVPSQASIYEDRVQVAEMKPIKRIPPSPIAHHSPLDSPPSFQSSSGPPSLVSSGPPSLVYPNEIFISDVELDID